MRDTIAQDLKHTRDIAKAIAYSKQYDVYALNHAWATYDIESQTGIETYYTLYDHDTVARLAQDGKVLPEPGKKLSEEIREGKAQKWTDKQISSVTMQAILQGESIPHMAMRIALTLGEMERKRAVRTARTACTSAENAGRLDGYRRCQAMGIKLKKQWMAAHDNRTRDWHRYLDGVRQDIEKPFVNDWGEIMYPGDPNAAGANVYNCRCTLIAAINGHEIDGSEVYKNNHRPELDGISWEEWKKGKQSKNFKNRAKQGIINSSSMNTNKESKPDYYTGANRKTLPAKYKNWIGKNEMQDMLNKSESEVVKRIICSDFRKTSFIGNGDTASIRKFEITTGLNCGRNGNNHKQKVQDLIRQIQKGLSKDISESDKKLLRERLNALKEVDGYD